MKFSVFARGWTWKGGQFGKKNGSTVENVVQPPQKMDLVNDYFMQTNSLRILGSN